MAMRATNFDHFKVTPKTTYYGLLFVVIPVGLMTYLTLKEKELGIEMKPDDHRMATNRCSQLIAIAMANQLDEAWISMHPELSYLYLNQYFPPVARR
nr:hypothetical protein BaRGS_032083 [Batillaria attramentaria]